MKTPLFASLPAKVAAGVAGVALLTGGAGTVLNLQPAGTTSTTEDTVETAEVEETTTTTTSTTSTTEASATKKKATTFAEDEDGETVASTEHPDNFGAMVSEDAKDGGVDGQEISAKAHARNEARRADRAATSADDTDDDDDDDTEDDEDEDDEDEEDETTLPADAHRKDERPGKG